MKVITIIEDDKITGVKYGTVEIPETQNKTIRSKRVYKQVQKVREMYADRVRAEHTKNK